MKITPKLVTQSLAGMAYLVETAREGGTRTYTELGNAIGVNPRHVGYPLLLIGQMCQGANLPILSSLAVQAGTGEVGTGYFIPFPGHNPVADREECFRFWARGH